MTEYTLAVNTNTDELAEVIAGGGYAAALDFVKALDTAMDNWYFTKAVRDWAKAEMKALKDLGYTS